MPTLCVIFDIDGTLVDTGGFESRLYQSAVRESLGDVRFRTDWGEYEYVTDTGILRDVCRDNQLDLAGIEQRVRMRFGELVSEYLRGANTCDGVAGALAFWKVLRANPAFEIGIATGGWGHTARMKLNSAGYDYDGIPIATSDDSHERTAIMKHCRAMLDPSIPTVYLGDGEWDLVAAERLGWRFIGVGERLSGKCAHWIRDFHSEDSADRLIARSLPA
jgi:phosphoglycolate phosphatase-like HAD superfamily hydrolase